MNELPLISIVTPSFNQAPYLRQCIESVLQQHYAPIEFIVMDGGSTDSSVEIIRQYAHRLAYWTSAPDGGQAAAIQQGWQRSHGAIIAWLNSDDYYEPDAFMTVVEAMREHPAAGVYSGDCRIVDAQGRFVRAAPGAAQGFGLAHLSGNSLPQPALFFRREAVERVGGLNPTLRYVMDWDLLMRLWLSETCFHYVPAVLAASRMWGETKTANNAPGFALERAQLLAQWADTNTKQALREAHCAALLEVALCYRLRGELCEAARWLNEAISAERLGRSLPQAEGLALRLADSDAPGAVIDGFVAALAEAHGAWNTTAYPQDWRSQLRVRLHIVRAWNAVYAGCSGTAARHFATAIRYDPSLLRERGVIAPLVKSLLNSARWRQNSR